MYKEILKNNGSLNETTRLAHCVKGDRRIIFIQDKKYPIYTFKSKRCQGKDLIFSEDGFPFFFGINHHLEENKDKKCWELKEEESQEVWFEFKI